jgi:DNA-binding winged helix-turn-helix (wHTH) protein
MRLAFGDCLFDDQTRQLVRNGEVVHLKPKAFELLSVLLADRPRAISKKELNRALWPDAFVSEANLASVVAELRTALGDDARAPRFLRTIHGFGYAFSGEASEALALAAPRPSRPFTCRLIGAGRETLLWEGANVLGRLSEATLSLPSKSVSRRHARITVAGADATIEDLGSKNGTWVGDRKVTAPTPLHDGDTIRLGRVTLTFRVTGDDATETV